MDCKGKRKRQDWEHGAGGSVQDTQGLLPCQALDLFPCDVSSSEYSGEVHLFLNPVTEYLAAC